MATSSGLLLNQANQSTDLYVRALTAAYRSGIRLYDPDLATTTDWEIDEKLQRDPEIKAALEKRWHDVAGRDWKVEPASDRPADKQAAAIMEELLGRIDGFTQARYRLAKATIFSRAFEFVETCRCQCAPAGTMVQSWLVPCRLRNVDARRFDFSVRRTLDPATGREVSFVAPRLWSVERGRWEDVTCPDVFVKIIYDDEEARLGYGRGLREALHFFFRFKTVLLEHGLQGAERWAQGLVIAKIDDARVGSVGKSNEDIRDAILDEIKKTRSQHIIAIGKGDEVQVVQTSGTGHAAVMDLIQLINESMVRLILGSVRPTGGGEGGSLARTSEEAAQSEALIQYDRQLIDEAFTRDLIGLLWRYNRDQFRALGLAGAKAPKFRTEQKKVENYKENADIVSVLMAAGVPLRADEVYAKTGFSRPGPQDETITKPPPPPSPTAFPPGFGGAPDPFSGLSRSRGAA